MGIKETADNDKVPAGKFIDPIKFAKFLRNHLDLWSKIQGAKIHHSIYGYGEITCIEQRAEYIPLISVFFENDNKERMFNSESFESEVIEAIYISEAQNEALQSWKKLNPPVRNPMLEDKQPCFSDFGVNSLWHMTHYENITSILKHGILNHHDASQFKSEDISDPDVQKRRQRVDPCYRRKVHEYAPLYINPRNPMMYVRKNLQSNLCLLEICLSVLSENEYLITDGNAASYNTKFYDSMSGLNFLPWDVLNSDSWNDKKDGKRKMCAEVLIYHKIDSKYIKALHFRNFIPSLDCGDMLKHITPKLFF